MAEKDNNFSKSEKEKKDKYLEFQKAVFATATQLQFGNLLKETTSTYTQYTKEKYRTLVQNPKKSEKDLRAMSQFLSRVSMPYKRLLWYFSSLYYFYWNLTPKFDNINKLPDMDKLFKQFNEACSLVDKMDISVEMVNVIYFTLRDGIFYGFLYDDDKSTFIHRLNPDYCKPVQIEAGVLNYAFDFSYFKKYPEALDTWDSSFTVGYKAYEKDNTKNRWQILDPEKTICIKADPDLEENLPFFLGMFEALLDLIDARTLQRNKDIIQNYKLILQKIPLFSESNAKDIDDFKLDLDTVIKFSGQLADNVPDAVGVITTPMELDTIDFKSDDNSSDIVSSSMRQIFDDSGVSQLLFNSNTSGSTGIDSSIKSDVSITWNIVKSIERWITRYLNYKGSNIKFDFEILDVNIFNKEAAIKRELSLANSGVPNKTKLAATAGLSPLKITNNMIWENEYLKIHEKWLPLQTSYTMSSKEVGRPNTDDDPAGSISDKTAINKDAGEASKIEK